MQNINPNTLIKTLLQKKIDIHELEQEIEHLKDSLSQVDPFLLVEIQTKLSNAKDLQNRVAEFIDNTYSSATNLSADNLMVASDSLQEAAKLKIDFAELKQLEILTKMSAWLTKVYIALKPTTASNSTNDDMEIENQTMGGNGTTSQVDVNETIHQIQTLISSLEDASQIEGKTKWKLKPIIAEIKSVEFKDPRLSKISQELVQIIWAKEGLDLLKKDKFSREELTAIKEEIKEYTRFKDIYQKINEIYSHQKSWFDESSQLFEQKTQSTIENSIKNLTISQEILNKKEETKSKQSEYSIQSYLSQIQKLVTKYNDYELSKVTDFEQLFIKLRNLEKQLMWVQESYAVIKNNLYGNGSQSESFSFKTLQTMHEQALERKIPQEWPIFQEMQLKFQTVAKLLQTYSIYEQARKKFNANQQQQQLHHQQENSTISVGKFDFYDHNKSKPEYNEIIELISEMKAKSATTIDMRTEINQLIEDKEKVDQLIQKFEEFQQHYSEYILSYDQNATMIDESLFMVIKDELNTLKSCLMQTPLYLKQQETFLYQFELNFEALNLILNSKSSKQADIQEWQSNYQRILNININQFIRDEIAKEIGYYDKITAFVSEIRKFNQSNNTNKKIDRSQLKTSNELGEIYNILSQCRIHMKNESELIDSLINKIQQLENSFNTMIKLVERKPITDFSNLLENIKKIPIKMPTEEQKLGEILQTAEMLITNLKSCQQQQLQQQQQNMMNEENQMQQEQADIANNNNIYDLIQQYQEQRVWLIEYEKLVKNFNQNEENLKMLEEQVKSINEMNIEQICELGNKLDEIPDNFQMKRLSTVRKEIYLRKVRVFKEAWEDTSGFITYSISLRGIKDRSNEGKNLVKIYNELELKQAIVLLEEVIRKVEDKLNLVKRIKDLEKLSALENDPSEVRLKCVDFAEEFIEHKLMLQYDKMYKEQPPQIPNRLNTTNLPTNQQPNILPKDSTITLTNMTSSGRGVSVHNNKRGASTYNSRRSASTARLLGKRKLLGSGKTRQEDDDIESENEWDQKLLQEVEKSKTFGAFIFNKTNIVKQIQAIIATNKYWKLQEVEQQEYAIKVADYIEKCIKDKDDKQQQIAIKQMYGLLKRLKNYDNLSKMILNVEFSHNLLAAFQSKNEKQLEILNKKQVKLDNNANNVQSSKKMMSQRDDFVIKKKKQKKFSEFNTITNQQQPANINEQIQQQQQKPEGKKSVIPSEFLDANDSDSEYFNYNYDSPTAFQFQQFQQMQQKQQLMPEEIQKLIQERTLLQRFRIENGTLQQRKLFETQEDMNEEQSGADGGMDDGEFSDDEGQNMFKDFEPLKEDEVEEFQKFLIKQGTLGNDTTLGFLQLQPLQLETGKILFDPENDEFNAETQQKMNQGLVPLKGSTLKIFEGSIKYSQTRNISLNINMLSLEFYNKMRTFPDYQTETNKNSFSITKKLHVGAFQSYVDKLQKQQKDKKNHKKKALATGWLEPSCLSKLDQFNEISEELRRNDQILLIKWSSCCKLFILHSEQIQMQWNKLLKFKQKPVMQSLDEINLVFVMIFKQYKMGMNDTKIRPIVIHGIFEETKKPTEYFNQIENPKPSTTTATEQQIQQQNQQQQMMKKPMRRYRMNQSSNLLQELMNPGKFASNIQAFSKEISMQQKFLNKYQRQQGQAMKSRLIKESLNQMMNEKSIFQKQEQFKQMRQSVDRKSVDTRRQSVDRKSVDRKSMNRKSMDRKSMSRKSVDRKSMSRKSVDRKSMSRKSVDRKSMDRKSVNQNRPSSVSDIFKVNSNSKRVSKSKSRQRRSKSRSTHNNKRGESKFKSMQSLKVNKIFEQVDREDTMFASSALDGMMNNNNNQMINYDDIPQTTFEPIYEDVQLENQQYPEIDILGKQKKRSSSRRSKSKNNNDRRSKSKSKSKRRSKSKSKSKRRSTHKKNFLDEPLSTMMMNNHKHSVPVDISGAEFDAIYSHYNTEDNNANVDNMNNEFNFNQEEFEMINDNLEGMDVYNTVNEPVQQPQPQKSQQKIASSQQPENQQVKTLTTLMETINKSLSQFLKSNESQQQSQQIQSQQQNKNQYSQNDFSSGRFNNNNNNKSNTQIMSQNQQNNNRKSKSIMRKNNNQQFHQPDSQDLFEFSASQPNFNNQNVQQQFRRSVSKRNNNNNNATTMNNNAMNQPKNNNLNGIWKRSQSNQRRFDGQQQQQGQEQQRFNSKSRQRSSQSRQRSSSHARQNNMNGNNNNNMMKGGANYNNNNNYKQNYGQNNFNNNNNNNGQQGGRGFSRDRSQFKNNNMNYNNNNNYKFENKENFNKFNNNQNNNNNFMMKKNNNQFFNNNNNNRNGSVGRNSINNRNRINQY